MNSNYLSKYKKQFKGLCRELNKEQAKKASIKKSSLIDKITLLYQKVRFTLPKYELKKLLSGASFLLLFGSTAHAQLFAPPVKDTFGLSDIGNSSSIAFVDIDNDGDQDLFTGSENGSFWFFKNIGTSTIPAFDTPIQDTFGLMTTGGAETTPVFVDIDNDGDMDMFSGEFYSYQAPNNPNIYFVKNVGTAAIPAFSAPVKDTFGIVSPITQSLQPTFVDIDNDGDMDMFSGERYGSTYYFRNTGSNTNPSFAPYAKDTLGWADLGPANNQSAIGFVDIDNDGDQDLFSRFGTFVFAENIGTAFTPMFDDTIQSPFGLTTSGYWSNPVFVDIDNDGDMDMFSGHSNGSIYFFQNIAPVAVKGVEKLGYEIIAYPNPANTSINIIGYKENWTIRIYDLQGRLMMEANQKTIDISALNNGAYFLTVFEAEKALYTEKIVVNKQ